MTNEEIAKYVVKREYSKKQPIELVTEATNKKILKYYEPHNNLKGPDFDVVNLIADMNYDERKVLEKIVWGLKSERWNHKYEVHKKSYNKMVKNMEKQGEDFKNQMEVGDVVEVIKTGGVKGKMYVMDLAEHTFTGRYVYQKMDMYDQFKKTGQVTDKMYKFVTKIICKNAKIIS